MKNKKTSSKLHCSKVIFHLLLLISALSFITGMAQAANSVKKVYDKWSQYGSTIDQTSICKKELGRNSQVLYKTTRNGSSKTKFVFNAAYFNKSGERYAHAFLRVKDKKRKFFLKKNVDFGNTIFVDAKGVASIDSYCEVKIKGKFAAGVKMGS